MNKLIHLWKHKKEIAEAWWNYLTGGRKIREMAWRRMSICRTNKCGKYDEHGTSEAAYIKGLECCGVCGCIFPGLQSTPGAECSLADINEEPLWKAETIK